MNVLIVDNDKDTANTLALLLKNWGVNPLVTYSGPEALQAVRDQRPDVALIDLSMPKMDGFEVAKRIREISAPPAKQPVLIAMSGYGQEELGQRCPSEGFAKYFLKPLYLEELRQTLQEL